MSHDLRALSQDWFASVWNQQDQASLARLTHPNLLCHGLGDSEQPQPGFHAFAAQDRGRPVRALSFGRLGRAHGRAIPAGAG